MPLPVHHYEFDTLGATTPDSGTEPVDLALSGYSKALSARVGSGAVSFLGSGNAAASTDVLIDFTGPFTYASWYRVDHLVSLVMAVFRYADGPEEREIGLSSARSLAEWTHITTVRSGDALELYVNGALVDSQTVPAGWGNPVGFALIAHDRYNDEGHCSMDDTRIYNAALTQEEINELITAMPALPSLYYEINGLNFKSFGVYVSKSSGLYDDPDRKEPESISWPEYHGVFRALDTVLFEVRNIRLDCFILGESENDLVIKFQAFMAEFNRKGTQRLTMYGPAKPFFFEVWRPKSPESERKSSGGIWSREFTLTLEEPQPVKRVLRFVFDAGQPAQVSFTITVKTLLTVFWGDGTKTNNVYGTALTVSHTYAVPGEYFIVLAGNIDDITAFTTNAEILWDRL